MDKLLEFFLLLSVCSIVGQSIQGIITDAGSGNPLSGAHIVIEEQNTERSVIISGSYSISGLPDGEYSVKATYIGYETSSNEIVVSEGHEAVADFRLNSKPYLAEEAIITANRVEVSRNITPMTVSLVSRQALENDGGSNLLPIIGKQVPGVFVTERGVTGFGVADGSAGKISIRGIGGSPNTQVLVLIDGHPQYMGLFGHPLARCLCSFRRGKS